MDYGKILREIRERHGLTQGDLAEKIGVAHNSIGRIESGKMAPSAKTASKIRALACELLPGGYWSGMTYEELDVLGKRLAAAGNNFPKLDLSTGETIPPPAPSACPSCTEKDERIKELKYTIKVQKDLIESLNTRKG